MVLIIAGAAQSGRNTVCKLLAETLGWEFVDTENLAQSQVDSGRESTSRAHADHPGSVATLSAAINRWIYEWRDVAVSCPALTEGERKQLSRMSSLVRIVCLDEFHSTDRTRAPGRAGRDAISHCPVGEHASCDAEQNVFNLDLFRPVEEIIAELTAVLMA